MNPSEINGSEWGIIGATIGTVGTALFSWLTQRRKGQIDETSLVLSKWREISERYDTDFRSLREELRKEHAENGELRHQLRELEDKFERKMDEREAEHAAVAAVLRHRLNNVTQCFDALLLLIKQDPTRAADAVSQVEEMRARQIVAEAQEKAALSAARIVAASGPVE